MTPAYVTALAVADDACALVERFAFLARAEEDAELAVLRGHARELRRRIRVVAGTGEHGARDELAELAGVVDRAGIAFAALFAHRVDAIARMGEHHAAIPQGALVEAAERARRAARIAEPREA